MLFVRYTDPPTHIVGEDEQVFPAIIDEGRQAVEELDYARLDDFSKERTPVIIRRPRRVTLCDDEVRSRRPAGMDDLALVNNRSPGDVVAMTAVVRELHRAHPGRFRTVVQTWFPQLWENNPYITSEAEIVQPRRIDWDWRNSPPADAHCHFVNCWRDDLARQLGISIPLTDIRGDIYMTEAERQWPSDLLGDGPRPFALVNAGWKRDTALKNWGREKYQAVVDHFAEKIEFVQIGKASEHCHQPLRGVTNLLDQTGIRDLVRLVYWADLVLCPITFVMHLSAAIPLRNGGIRPCIVLAGGREPASLIQYDGHTVLGTVGALSCCKSGACWRSHVQPEKGTDLMTCLDPVHGMGDQWVGRCMEIIPVRRVIDAVMHSPLA